MKFRPPAVPLICVDPYFSIWSFGDNLYDDHTRHWTGRRNALVGLLKVDSVCYRFMGKVEPFSEHYFDEPEVIPQVDVNIRPMTTTYVFENELLTLQLKFMTPLVLNDVTLLSTPVSYLQYDVMMKDNQQHDVTVYFDIAAECCVDHIHQNIQFHRTDSSVACGNIIQRPLNKSGDDHRIDWGYLHLVHEKAQFSNLENRKKFVWGTSRWSRPQEELVKDKLYNIEQDYPVLSLETKQLSDLIMFAYDDVKSIEYFGKHLDCYYKKEYASFDDMLLEKKESYPEVCKKVSDLEDDYLKETGKISEKYQEIASLAYRQAIAAHKTAWDGDNIIFMSKECFSNGCIGTVDVTYPSIPLFLRYNPELVKGMLRPIFKFAASDEWPFNFAPHDVGQYPLANGQVYGGNKLEKQMPIEECGNMLITVCAICKAEGNNSFAEENQALLKQWAQYLYENGYDPCEQLCTDDFAGHLAHNCNLSIKAIMGMVAYGLLFEDDNYLGKAKELASKWKEDAFDTDHYKLSFTMNDSWSLKYNIVWDKIWGTNIFDSDIFETETKFYLTKQNEYGIPLDSRDQFTKTDWLMWTTAMTDNQEYRDTVIELIWKMLCETKVRVPLTDWYDTNNAGRVTFPKCFQNRTVVGGLLILLLLEEKL